MKKETFVRITACSQNTTSVYVGSRACDAVELKPGDQVVVYAFGTKVMRPPRKPTRKPKDEEYRVYCHCEGHGRTCDDTETPANTAEHDREDSVLMGASKRKGMLWHCPKHWDCPTCSRRDVEPGKNVPRTVVTKLKARRK